MKRMPFMGTMLSTLLLLFATSINISNALITAVGKSETLDFKLACKTNVSDGKEILVGSFVELKCEVEYDSAQKRPPSTQWKDANGNPVDNATIQNTPGRLSSSIIIQVLLTGFPSFTSTSSNSEITQIWKPDNMRIGCPPGFTALPGSSTCYSLLIRSSTWDDALKSCNSLVDGSYLAMITSSAEQTAVMNHLNATGKKTECYAPRYGFSFWISYRRPFDNCQPVVPSFVWKPAPGKSFDKDFPGWRAGEPNCANGNEYCTLLSDLAGFRAFDAVCHYTTCALCEYGPF